MEVKSKHYRDEGSNEQKHNAACDPSSKHFSVSTVGFGVTFVTVNRARLEIRFGVVD